MQFAYLCLLVGFNIPYQQPRCGPRTPSQVCSFLDILTICCVDTRFLASNLSNDLTRAYPPNCCRHLRRLAVCLTSTSREAPGPLQILGVPPEQRHHRRHPHLPLRPLLDLRVLPAGLQLHQDRGTRRLRMLSHLVGTTKYYIFHTNGSF